MSDPVARLNAALEGRYAIERELGEGGMAAVYLADDLKHGRKVALKVLKPELAAVVGAERFLAEIKTTAKLQHPHILPLHDSGEADGFLFYVMPYVEGESLRQRLDREHQLPVTDAVQIATDVGEALDYAHRQGVIHRDIKPANVLLLEGKPVISDFGIALAVGAAGGGRLTETGLSLGTPHYMSPEQATGDQNVGPQTDTYALGCVLYEMLVGEPPFTGPTAQAVLGQIITGEAVSATKKRASIPRNVDAAIRKALEKLPADRFTSAQEFVRALGDEHFRYGEAVAGIAWASASAWNRLTMAMTMLAASLALTLGWALLRPEPPPSVARFRSPFLPGPVPAVPSGARYDISDDGSTVVYSGPGSQLWMHRWRDLESSPIPGTEGALGLALSPDGRGLAFSTAGEEVRVLSVAGGPARTLSQGFVSFWGPDGYIYATVPEGTVRVGAEDGSPQPVTRQAEGHRQHIILDVFPDGRGALVEVRLAGGGDRREIHALDLRTGAMKPLTPGRGAFYSSTGHLVFGAAEGNDLMAVRFDPDAMEVTGDAVSVMSEVVGAHLSRSGTLVYTTGAEAGRLEFVWTSHSGQAEPVEAGWSFSPGGSMRGWSLSPNGRRLAYTADEAEPGNLDVWIKELPTGPSPRLTDGEEPDWGPRWAPGGEMITFTVQGGGVWQKRADGIGAAEPLFESGDRDVAAALWSPDGEWLVLRLGALAASNIGNRDIVMIRPGVDSLPLPLLSEEDYAEVQPAISPDGRWLAYASDESGRFEVYVRPFPDVDAGNWQVSTDGGLQPLWAHSGRELFFVSANREMWAAQYETVSGFRVVGRELLFEVPSEVAGILSQVATNYDISSDDQLFLMARRVRESGSASYSGFVVVQNWTEELKELLPN